MMGPSARHILHRIEAGERVSPAQARAAVSMLHDAYDELVTCVTDYLHRANGIRRSSATLAMHDMHRLVLVHELLLRNEDLSTPYAAIGSAHDAIARAMASQKEID